MAKRRIGRVLLIVIALLVVLPAAALAIFAATFDPNRYKPQIAEAVKRATGRDLALNGPLRVKLSLHPTIEASQVALANIEGGSRPEMAAVDHVEARIALLPLLHRRLEIDRLALSHPDILLETDREGRPNWRFGPAVPSQPLPTPAPANASKAPPPEILVREVRIEDAAVAYRDGRTGRTKSLKISRLDAAAPNPNAPMRLSMQARYNDAPFTADAETGPLTRLRDAAAAEPWPVRLLLGSGEARITFAGGVARPLEGKGYDLKLDGAIPDLAALQPFYPRAKLPPFRNVTLTARIRDRGGPVPAVSSFALHAGASDLSAYAAGLSLAKLDASASAMDQPVRVEAEGAFAGSPLVLTATTGALGGLIPGANRPAARFSVEASAQFAGAELLLNGTIADPAHRSGVDAKVAGRVPDLGAFSPLVRRPLPPLKDAVFEARVSDAEGGFSKGVAIKDAKLTVPQGDLAGDATLSFGRRPSLRAEFASQRIDADGIRALWNGEPAKPAPASAPAIASPPPASTAPAPALPAPAAPPRAARPAPSRSGLTIPDTPLPFDRLLQADADIQARVEALTWGGIAYRDVSGRVVLDGGTLRIGPVTAELPGGPFQASAVADGSQASPALSVKIQAPGVAIQPLLRAAGLPDDATGSVEVDADLRSAGATPHQLAAALDGHIGLAMVNGEIDNRLIAATLGEVLRRSNLPDIGARAGRSAVRCLALRFDAVDGVATARAFLLDTTLFHLLGTGSLDLRDETLALRLEPLARLGGTGVMVPLRVRGTFREPKAVIDAGGAAQEAARLAESAAAKDQRFGIIIGALGGDRMIAGAGRDNCAEQLAIARGGRDGPAPAAPEAAPRPHAPKPADLLRQFLR